MGRATSDERGCRGVDKGGSHPSHPVGGRRAGARVGAKLASLRERTSPLVRGSGARREPAAVAIRTRPEGES